jgi:Protein of unknown function (DUF4231)
MDSVKAAPSELAGRGPAQQRLEDQIAWYDAKSTAAQRTYKRLKILQLLSAAAVPVTAAADAVTWVIVGLGCLVLILEGLQQLGQYHENWINYRATSQALKREKYLYLAGAGPYAQAAKPDRTLAERVEGLASQEYGRWAEAREERGHPIVVAGDREARADLPGDPTEPY